MNKVMRKLKKSKKPFRILYYGVIIVYLITFIMFTCSLISLKGIETLLRVILIIFFMLYILIFAFWNLLNLLRKKYKGLFITSIISVVFILIFSYCSYYINFVYNNLNNITEEKELLYTSYLITLKDTEFNDKSNIGIISKDVEPDDYDLANKLYKDKKISNNTKDYDDYIKMLNDLYAKKIDAIFVPGNYVTLFQNEEGFYNIRSDTKIIYEYSEKKKNEDLNIVSNKKFNEPLTFLLLGVDSEKQGLNAKSAFNGDTLMLVSFNPKTLNTVMVSIPRDTYVPIACRNNAYSKINSSAAYGTNCVINTINNFLDVNIDYYVKINFKGVVELVDALGGVEVDVEKPYFNSYQGVNYKGKMCEQNSDRQFGNKLVCINPGFQTLNGEQALAYARNRHLYVGGDLDRIKHQQQVVEAIANKSLGFKSIGDFQKILNAISNNLATNMDVDTMLSGYQVIKNMVGNLVSGKDALNISKAYLETYSLSVYVPSQGRNTSAQGYYLDSLEDIKKAINVVLEKENNEAIKTFDFNVNKPYEIYSPGKGKRSKSSGALLPNFVGLTIDEATKICNSANIKMHTVYVDEGDEHYNSLVTPGKIGSQSVHKNVLLSAVSDITFYIPNAKKEVVKSNDDESNKSDIKEDVKDTTKKDEDIVKDMIENKNTLE